MGNDVGRAVAALDRMTTAELCARFAEVFGETTVAGNREWLLRRIAWRLQAKAEGDLSERAKRRAAELADDADLRLTPPRAAPATPAREVRFDPDGRLPPPGTVLTRPYKGDVVRVTVRADGFEYAGAVYRSLSARSTAPVGSSRD